MRPETGKPKFFESNRQRQMMITIENEHLLTSRFGRWPSFHDAEIVRARFERQGADSPFLECEIHVFEMTNDVDRTGHYVLKHHTLVTIRFCDIGLECFKWWNHQNVLAGLKITPTEPSGPNERGDWPIQVEMPSSYGCEAQLVCKSIKILSAEEYREDDQ
jgi:hypothetical protein